MAGIKIGEIDFGEGSFGNPANLVADAQYYYGAIISADRTRAIVGRLARGQASGGVCRTIALGSNRAQAIALAADPATGRLTVVTCALQDNGSRHDEIWDTELALVSVAAPAPAPAPAPATGNAAIVAQIQALLAQIV